jgi:NAD(P)-dependent dehydrogenase (short-subunit alcohol dehydrogenase family)
MLTNKVAIITGASRGIGLATAQALILEGVRVFAISRSALPIDASPAVSSLSRQI